MLDTPLLIFRGALLFIVLNITYLTYHVRIWESMILQRKDSSSGQEKLSLTISMSSNLFSISDADIILFMLFHRYSIGFRSGEIRWQINQFDIQCSCFSFTIFALCVAKLSRIKQILFTGLFLLTSYRNWQKSSFFV